MVAQAVPNARRDAAEGGNGQLCEWLRHVEEDGDVFTLAFLLAEQLARWLPATDGELELFVMAAAHDGLE